MDDDERLANALGAAVTAADNAAQAAYGIWHAMTAGEQDAWLERARTCWPRFDVKLGVILPAAEAIVTAENEADG
jgi:hypothetical protein